MTTTTAATAELEGKPTRRSSVGAAAVTAGILLSRLFGLARERVIAHYLGNSAAAGAFRRALTVPNTLQNLFGEGSLSASFIPVYAKLLAEGDIAGAQQVAGTVLALLTAIVILLTGIGMLATPVMIALFAPGFTGEIRQLTSDLVVIMFPGVGMLVIAAWCLGVLNSHRRFFRPYVAPVLWNIAMIAALPIAVLSQGDLSLPAMAHATAWGASVGAFFQLLFLLPTARKLNGGLRWSLTFTGPVRIVLRNAGPALLTRGVVQISALIDGALVSYIGPVTVATLACAQMIYLLPVSLFGTAAAASELPEMSTALGTADEIGAKIKARLVASMDRIAFFIVPSAVSFLVLGEVLASTLYQTGRFNQGDARSVWIVLIGCSVGILATTQSRLCVSAFWAMRDAKTPTRYAIIRVTLTAVLGYLAVFPLRQAFALEPSVACSLLVATAGFSGWLEFLLIKRALATKIGPFHINRKAMARCWIVALASAAVAYGVKQALPPLPPLLSGALILGVYGSLYLGGSIALGAEHATVFLKKLRRRLGR